MIIATLMIAFASWRITSLLYIEKPFAWLRKLIGIHEDDATNSMSYPCNIVGEILECFWCLSLCVALVLSIGWCVAFGVGFVEWFFIWMASAALTLVVDVRHFARLRG